MIASGGLDFDDIIFHRQSSSEDDINNKGRYSHRSDSSNLSADTEMPGTIHDLEGGNNPLIVKQKRIVMNEIKRKVFSSDSDRENEIYNELEDMYGKTPPREVRRTKQKFKCNVRFNNDNTSGQFLIRKTERKHHDRKSCPPSLTNGSFQMNWQRQRDEQRKEKHELENLSQELHHSEKRSTKLVRVNSAKSLKSIGQQRTVNFYSKREEFVSSSKFMPSTFKLETANKRRSSQRKSSRQHFHKSFSLLVNLGGRVQNISFEADSIPDEESDDFQVEYPEMLWLELQTWRSGQSLEVQDNYLEQARQKVDEVLDEVMNYRFVYKGSSVSLCPVGVDTTGSMSDSYDTDEMLTFTTSFDQVTDNERFEQLASSDDDSPRDVVTKMNSEQDPSAKTSEMLSLSKKKKVAAMREIMQLVAKIESVECLYPSMRALAAAHPKYGDVKFKRNMEAMLLWLNVNKDIFHKLNILAHWIDIDPEDMMSWRDWFDHALDMTCMKTKRSYETSHDITTAENLENSGNLCSLLSSVALRRSKREKRKRISQNRLSLIEKTATSRYRLFVERGIRDKQGMIGLMDKVRTILHDIVVKARSCLEDESHGQACEEDFIKARRNDMHGIYKHLLLRSEVDVGEFDRIMYDEMKKQNLSQYSKNCQDMCLPSFVDSYWFLKMVPFDVVHECLRFRLEYKPKVEPSHHSIRQLLNECKDVITGGVLCRCYMKDLLFGSLWEEKLGYITQRMGEFNDDLKALLNLYFDYLQNWFRIMQRSKQASDGLKSVIEEEWTFSKEICPFIIGGEARAGHKYCILVSGLLKSTEHFLETSVDECYSLHNPNDDDASQRHKMLNACRKYKEIFKEVRGRAITALGFAKMLQKDLGIASKYKTTVDFEAILKALRDSKHYKVEYHGMNLNFDIFVSEVCSKKQNFCTQLINLTFGYDDPDCTSYDGDGYVLLLPKQSTEKSFLWRGRCISIDVTPEASLALSYIEEVKYLTLICRNSYHLNTQRKRFEQIMEESVVVSSEHTSSHNVIAKALHELKVTMKTFAQVLISAVEHVNDNLNMNVTNEMDEADRNSTYKSCIETMHSCFSVGFEYLREVVRMYHGSNRAGIRKYFMKFARMWMQFVTTKTDKGRGKKPRWAVPGMEFLVATIDPLHTELLSEEEFQELQTRMHKCVEHIIGKAEPRNKRRMREKRSRSPFTVHRSRSVPSKQLLDGSLSTSTNKTFSLPGDFEKRNRSMQDISELSNSSVASANTSDVDTTAESIPTEFEDDFLEEDEDDAENDPPVIRIRNALQEIDERRTAKLQHMKVIGNVTYKKANFASELVHNVRRVNFKWQLGNKIGEGQFGKVYSAVNLDTGELMAVKQLRFNPHDYGTIQDVADEITNIQGITHNSLVTYFGVELHKDEMLIFMEYCADGTIADVAKVGLPESMIRVYTYQITKAINFLHQNGIIHRDIKGANIFVSSSGLIKIGDFGSAVKLKDPMCTSQGEVFNTRGTAAFMAPEVITLDKGRGYGRAADVWSLGCVVIEMTTGKQPWYDCDNIYAIMYQVGDGNHPQIPDYMSEEGKDFLKCCFVHDQNHRWTAHMLEDHPFVKCC